MADNAAFKKRLAKIPQMVRKAVRQAIEKGWGDGQDVIRTDFGNATAILHVPRFGKDFSVPVLEGDSDEVLAAGVGHMEDTEAGAVGNYVLNGVRPPRHGAL